jgi:hypothetical protein
MTSEIEGGRVASVTGELSVRCRISWSSRRFWLEDEDFAHNVGVLPVAAHEAGPLSTTVWDPRIHATSG